MAPRTQLQSILEGLLGSDNVYAQPPPGIQMRYPCIRYTRDSARTQFANNMPYTSMKRYMVTVIDRNPDSLIPDKIAALPLTTFVRSYTADNLNHFVFNIFF